MGRLLIRATRRVSPAHIRYVRPVPQHTAADLVARVYDQIEEDFGMLAPPVALHAAAPPVLAACWSILRETLLAPGRSTRRDREVVAATVSLANRCPYCVDVHGSVLLGLYEGPDTARIAAGRIDDVADPALRELARWARAADQPVRSPVRVAAAEAPELIGVALTFQYINRMVNVFLRESPLPAVPGAVDRLLRRTAAHVLGGLGRTRVTAGRSLDLLPAAALPPDLRWAAPSPHIAGAAARASAAITAAGERSVPERVRELVTGLLADPHAGRPGLAARRWVDESVTPLPEQERAPARVALFTAFASYRMTPDVIEDYRRRRPGDAALIELTSWASFTAARHIALRLGRDVELTA